MCLLVWWVHGSGSLPPGSGVWYMTPELSPARRGDSWQVWEQVLFSRPARGREQNGTHSGEGGSTSALRWAGPAGCVSAQLRPPFQLVLREPGARALGIRQSDFSGQTGGSWGILSQMLSWGVPGEGLALGGAGQEALLGGGSGQGRKGSHGAVSGFGSQIPSPSLL